MAARSPAWSPTSSPAPIGATGWLARRRNGRFRRASKRRAEHRMPRRSDAKERMVRSAARLFSVRGVDGTSFADVLEDSGAPRGSIYHHLRDGKRQLAEEAIRWPGVFILAVTAPALEPVDPVPAIAPLLT